MTQEEVQKKKICVKCKWCLANSTDHPAWTEFKFRCKNSVVSVDPVTGDEEYSLCLLVNGEGECPMFEEKTSNWIEKIFGSKES